MLSRFGGGWQKTPTVASSGATDWYVKTSGLIGSTVSSGATATADFTSPDTNVGGKVTVGASSVTLAAGLYRIEANFVFYKGASAEEIKVKSTLNANTWDQSTIVQWQTIPSGQGGNESSNRFQSVLISAIVNATTSGTVSFTLENKSATAAISIDTQNFRICRLGAAVTA